MNEWISVEEKLPEYGKDVLVVLENYNFDGEPLPENLISKSYYLACFCCRNGWALQHKDKNKIRGEIIYWMEFPRLKDSK